MEKVCKMTKNIQWPVYDTNDKKLIKDGSIDGISLKKIFKGCEKESTIYCKAKFPGLFKNIEQNSKG